MLSARIKVWGTDFKEILQSLLYEQHNNCVLCGSPINTEATPICLTCEKSYFHPELNRCLTCGKLIPKGRLECMDCKQGRGPKGLNQVVAWGHYTGEWKKFIQDMKFKAQPYRLKQIGQPLADWVIQRLPPPNLLVPVPMHLERIAERGFNQAAGIASLLHWELGIPILEVLERVHFTVPQVGLRRSDRLHNLKGVFQVVDSENERAINGAKIWLVDDVITTGATLEACARELKQKGASEVYGLTLAAGIEERQQKSTVQYNQSMV